MLDVQDVAVGDVKPAVLDYAVWGDEVAFEKEMAGRRFYARLQSSLGEGNGGEHGEGKSIERGARHGSVMMPYPNGPNLLGTLLFLRQPGAIEVVGDAEQGSSGVSVAGKFSRICPRTPVARRLVKRVAEIVLLCCLPSHSQ